MANTNIIRKTIRETLKDIFQMRINEYGGGYPAGAEYDVDAPWNDVTVSITYVIDYASQQFMVTADNGMKYNVDFIDVLEKYWRSHNNSYQQHMAKFGQEEATADLKTVQYLATQEKYDFSEILEQYGQEHGLLSDLS